MDKLQMGLFAARAIEITDEDTDNLQSEINQLRARLAKSDRLIAILESAVFELAEDMGHGSDVIDAREEYLIRAGHITPRESL